MISSSELMRAKKIIMGILTLIFIAAFFFTPLAYAAENSDSAEIIESEDVKGKVELDTNEPIQLNNEEKAFAEDAKSNSPEPFLKRTWDFVRGKPIDDSILLGMFSWHTSNDRDEYNETNNLLGIDYKGYSVGYFNNSYYNDTYYAGISRKIYEYRINKEIKLDVKYKLIGMHGYQDKYQNKMPLKVKLQNNIVIW